MSKFAKGCLIAAGSLLALGFVMCLIGFLAGGHRLYWTIRENEYLGEKLESYTEKIGNAVEKVVEKAEVNTVVHYSWPGDGYYGRLIVNNNEVTERSAHYQVSAAGIDELELVMGAGHFIIEEKETDDGQIDISFEGAGKCFYRTEENTLKIEGFEGIDISNNAGAGNFMSIQLPAGMYLREIDGDIGAGSVEMNSLRADKLSLEIGAASIQTNDMQLKDAELSVGAGEIIYNGSITGNLELECAMGNVELNLTGSEKEHSYYVESSAGDLTIGSYFVSGIAVEKSINNAGTNSNFTISSSVGSIAINFDE